MMPALRLIEARMWASEGVGGVWCWAGRAVAAIELVCALGEMSDAGDCADIRLCGVIPGRNDLRSRTMTPEAMK